MNNDYPEADYATRDRIIADHIKYTQGFLWTLANHSPRAGESAASASKWGWRRMSLSDTGNWPFQLYVARRRGG